MIPTSASNNIWNPLIASVSGAMLHPSTPPHGPIMETFENVYNAQVVKDILPNTMMELATNSVFSQFIQLIAPSGIDTSAGSRVSQSKHRDTTWSSSEGSIDGTYRIGRYWTADNVRFKVDVYREYHYNSTHRGAANKTGYDFSDMFRLKFKIEFIGFASQRFIKPELFILTFITPTAKFQTGGDFGRFVDVLLIDRFNQNAQSILADIETFRERLRALHTLTTGF